MGCRILMLPGAETAWGQGGLQEEGEDRKKGKREEIRKKKEMSPS